MSFSARMYQATTYLARALQINAPIDLGNLTSSIHVADTFIEGKLRFTIIIGGEVVDYAPYTNEKWIDERWNGKKNPNQGWIDRTISNNLAMIQQIVRGEITNDEVLLLLNNQNDSIANKMQERAKYFALVEQQRLARKG